jgi:N4-gp56 family major capsid protein
MAGSNPFNAAPQVTSIPNAAGGGTNTGTAASFIPQIWSDEVIAEYEKNLVLANLIKKMSMKGKKGDTIHVPSPVRGSASAKTAETSVSLIADTESELVIYVDQHWEYSRMIEDITETQALSSLRRFYTSDAGYALARQTDSILFNNGTKLGDGDGSDWTHSHSKRPAATTGALEAYAIDTTDSTHVFTDVSMRDALQILDDADVPMTGRFFVIPPKLCNDIRGIERYNSTDFVNNKGTVNGKIGELYGVDVYVSSNVPVIETAANNAGGGDVRGALLAHRDVYVLAEQIGVRSQTQYKQEFLSTLYTADRLFGTECYRPENGVVIAVEG